MSAGFRAVQWNRAKLVYDGILLAGVVLYIGAYLTLVYWLDPPKDQPAAIDLRIRAFGTCAFFMVEWYAVQHALPSLYDELTKVSDYGKFIGFPFKALGLVALLILFLMAATSHDYWLVFLKPPVWKGLHMALYVAYGLVVMHVALGVVQYDHNPFIAAMLASGFACVTV